jgi:hypothetical protein
MTDCRHCTRPAQLFLCNRCITELRDMLNGLPRFIGYLTDAARGQTRLGEPGRRTPRYRTPLDGASSLLSHLEPFPNEDTTNLNIARQERSQAALRHALGAARINLRASDLLDYVESVLVEWARDISQTTHTQIHAANTAGLAAWLARHTTDIATDPAAAVCYREIKQIVFDIEHVINRPQPLTYCGPCPTTYQDGTTCDVGLFVKRDTPQVKCWKCKTTHYVDELIDRALQATEGLLYTAAEVRETMAEIGRPIPPRTWHRWRVEERLPTRGWRGAEPMYWISDVKDLLDNSYAHRRQA